MTETLGQRITRLRDERGMSQGDLAEALDISRQSVSKWETDTSTPELEKLIRLAELFDISMDTLVLGKEPMTPEAAAAAEQPPQAPAPPAPIKLGHKREPISQTQKFVGLGLIGISLLFSLICLVFFAWEGLLSALMLSSPLWGCGILCLTVRKRLGLSCCWLIFILVTGYFYYATGTTQSAIFNRQFWIYGNIFSQITAIIEIVLLILLYLWTFLSFRTIRMPERLHWEMKPLIFAYIGCIVGYILHFVLLDVALPHFILTRFFMTEVEGGFRLTQPPFYHTYTFIVDAIGLLWIALLLLGARLLYNEYKAAKQKTE